MNDKDYSSLVRKTDELRALFALGQKATPFLEDFFVFLRDAQQLLEEIKTVTGDKTSQITAEASQHSDQSRADEKATRLILEQLDSIINKAAEIQEAKIPDASPVKILRLLHKAISEGKDLRPTLPMLSKAIEFLDEPKLDNGSDTKALAESITDSASVIMLAMQSRDISTQEIESVDHLLGSLQYKLDEMLDKLNSGFQVNEQHFNEQKVIFEDASALESDDENADQADNEPGEFGEDDGSDEEYEGDDTDEPDEQFATGTSYKINRVDNSDYGEDDSDSPDDPNILEDPDTPDSFDADQDILPRYSSDSSHEEGGDDEIEDYGDGDEDWESEDDERDKDKANDKFKRKFDDKRDDGRNEGDDEFTQDDIDALFGG